MIDILYGVVATAMKVSRIWRGPICPRRRPINKFQTNERRKKYMIRRVILYTPIWDTHLEITTPSTLVAVRCEIDLESLLSFVTLCQEFNSQDHAIADGV